MAAINVTGVSEDTPKIDRGTPRLVRNSSGRTYYISHNSTDGTIEVRAQVANAYNYTSGNSQQSVWIGSQNEQVSQSFTGDGNDLTGVHWLLDWIVGSPAGNLYARLYAHTGTYGTSSLPTGSALASSDAVDISIINNAYQDTYYFKFSTPYTLVNGTRYVMVLDATGLTTSDVNNRVGSWLGSGQTGNAAHDHVTSGWLAWPSNDQSLIIETDGTTYDSDFVRLDNENQPTEGASSYVAPSAAIDSSDIIHISYMSDAGKVSPLLYARFDTTTDTWVETDTSVVADIGGDPTATSLYTSIAIDSNDAPHIAFSKYPSVMGTDTYTHNYINKVGGTWGSEAELDNTAGNDYSTMSIAIDKDNYPVIVAHGTTSGGVDFLYASIGDANDPASFTHQTVGLAGEEFYGSIAVDSVGDHWIAFVNSGNIYLQQHVHADSWTSWQTAITNSNAGTFPALFIEGTDVYVFYEDNNNDIVYDMYNGSSWAGETTLETGTYNQVRVLGASKWTQVDGYTVNDDDERITSGGVRWQGQSFTGDGSIINGARIKMSRNGSPTGNITISLREHSGTYGNGVWAGSTLATMTHDVTTIGTTDAWYTFIFNTPFQSVDTTKYFLTIYFNGNTTDNIGIRNDSSSPAHGGNWAWGSTPAAQDRDMMFEVLSGPAALSEIPYAFISEAGTQDVWFNTLSIGLVADSITPLQRQIKLRNLPHWRM